MGLTPVMLWPACLLAVRNQPVRPEANLPFAGLRGLRRAVPQIAPATGDAPRRRNAGAPGTQGRCRGLLGGDSALRDGGVVSPPGRQLSQLPLLAA